MKKKNRVKLIIIVIVAVFLLINAAWFAYVQVNYAPYKNGLGNTGTFGEYYGNISECGVGLLYPVYLDFKNPGDISLTHQGEKCGISFHAWLSAPLGDKKNAYGITIYDKTEDNGTKGLTESHSMYVDQNGYPIENTEENLAVYKEYKSDIEFMFGVFRSLKQ